MCFTTFRIKTRHLHDNCNPCCNLTLMADSESDIFNGSSSLDATTCFPITVVYIFFLFSFSDHVFRRVSWKGKAIRIKRIFSVLNSRDHTRLDILRVPLTGVLARTYEQGCQNLQFRKNGCPSFQ